MFPQAKQAVVLTADILTSHIRESGGVKNKMSDAALAPGSRHCACCLNDAVGTLE